MLIGIDISQLIYQGSGVANYTYNLVKNLLLYDKKTPRNFFTPHFVGQKKLKKN